MTTKLVKLIPKPFVFSDKIGPAEYNPAAPHSFQASVEVNSLLADFNTPPVAPNQKSGSPAAHLQKNPFLLLKAFQLCHQNGIECPKEILDFLAHICGAIAQTAFDTKRKGRKGDGLTTKEAASQILEIISNTKPIKGPSALIQEHRVIVEDRESMLADEEKIAASYRRRMTQFIESESFQKSSPDDLRELFPNTMNAQYRAAVLDVFPMRKNGNNPKADAYLAWRKREARDQAFEFEKGIWSKPSSPDDHDEI